MTKPSSHVILRNRWIALLALAFLLGPFLLDAVHHLSGSELHLPHSAFLHRWRAMSVVVFAAIAACAFGALRFTSNALEKGVCWSVGLWFAYEALRFAAWLHTHHLLTGPFSWICWVPALGFLIARNVQLWREGRRSKQMLV